MKRTPKGNTAILTLSVIKYAPHDPSFVNSGNMCLQSSANKVQGVFKSLSQFLLFLKCLRLEATDFSMKLSSTFHYGTCDMHQPWMQLDVPLRETLRVALTPPGFPFSSEQSSNTSVLSLTLAFLTLSRKDFHSRNNHTLVWSFAQKQCIPSFIERACWFGQTFSSHSQHWK